MGGCPPIFSCTFFPFRPCTLSSSCSLHVQPSFILSSTLLSPFGDRLVGIYSIHPWCSMQIWLCLMLNYNFIMRYWSKILYFTSVIMFYIHGMMNSIIGSRTSINNGIHDILIEKNVKQIKLILKPVIAVENKLILLENKFFVLLKSVNNSWSCSSAAK